MFNFRNDIYSELILVDKFLVLVIAGHWFYHNAITRSSGIFFFFFFFFLFNLFLIFIISALQY